MSIPLVVNGVTYDYPETSDSDWGAEATDWAAAITAGTLQKAGGLFQILSELDFGTSFGVRSLYYKSRTANVADAGQLRLARADVISWRNEANSANLDLSVDAAGVLNFDGTGISAGGTPVQTEITVTDTATINLTLLASDLSADIVAGSITNSMIHAAAAIAFTKLAALTSGNLLVGSAGNVATSVAMSGDAAIVASGALTIQPNVVTNAKLSQMPTLTFKGNNTGGTANALDLTGTQATAMLTNFVGDSGSGGTKGLVPAPASGDAAASKFLKADGTWTAPTGSGDVVGPASSTDNALVVFDGLTGKLLKNSLVVYSSGALTGITDLTVTGTTTLATSLTGVVKAVSGVISAATIVNADVSASAAIAYSKLNLSTSILNADINASAAIAVNKLAALTFSRALVSDGSGFIAAATTTAAEIGYLNGVSSSIQTQLNAKMTNPMTTGGDVIYGGASGTPTRLANGSAGDVLSSGGGTNAPSWFTPGQYVEQLQTTLTNAPTSTNLGDAASLTLGAGTYDITATMYWSGQANVTRYMMGIGTVAGNNSTGVSSGVNDSVYRFGAQDLDFSMCVPSYRVTPGGSTTYYLKVSATFSGTAPQYRCRLSAVRIK